MQASNVVKTVAKTAVKVTETKTHTLTAPAAVVAGEGLKRQRSLMDMFGGTAKRAKVDGAGAATVVHKRVISSSNGVNTLNSIPFSLSAYKASLSPEEKKYLSLECETMGLTWLKVLKDEIRKPYFLGLKHFLETEGVMSPDVKSTKVFPQAKDIYSWSRYTPLGKVRVVIIGQDPYHNVGQAHGLCFSVPPGVTLPGSLKNIYAEIASSYPSFDPPKHGYLLSWARSGVLLLNTSLTVRAHMAGSHALKGWETFVGEVIKAVDQWGGANIGNAGGKGRGVVFMAWGQWAQKRVAGLDKKKHCILTSAHPSPLSAHRGFLGNGHFLKANQWLQERYGSAGQVDWCNLSIDGEPAQGELAPSASQEEPLPPASQEGGEVVEEDSTKA
ncbi:uracil-DNA glycosylase [Dacryopinax primogenitus]|uniref:Uracil-DNA glycosylase n=1 Tax=Dacryopinax primogenitus (strain DJM 731) TaxID=1858805 RepID=M5GE49_DACPD|nr:uracil-DNA glycosylase [Dacryopinax primogenitus]EJU02978.1 uracil-DNA glycosylase [Dacryopinax primogenitus]